MEFTGKLGRYKVIETQDNTFTVWSEFFDENCHNLSGAYEETMHNYIHGCHLLDQLQTSQNDIHVFDVGFGVGIGLKCLVKFYQDYYAKHNGESDQKRSLTYYSIEIDEDLFLWSSKQNLPGLSFTKENNLYKTRIELKEGLFLEVVIIIGDGTLTLPLAQKAGILPAFTAIFQDAFSPKKNPALWSVSWFKLLKELSSIDVYLSTYSSAVTIRKSLINAGWMVFADIGFGMKKNMTKARTHGTMDEELLLKLSRSPLEAIV